VNILFWLLSFHPAANIIMQFPNCTHISQWSIITQSEWSIMNWAESKSPE
jgi:hypothetical protein